MLTRPLTIILLSPEMGAALVAGVAFPAPRAGLVDLAMPPTGAAAGREARGALRRRPADLREALWISSRLWSSLLDIVEVEGGLYEKDVMREWTRVESARLEVGKAWD
jgi:hypothetical protein